MKTHSDPLLEPSQCDGSNEGSEHVFREILKIIPKLSLLFRLIWGTGRLNTLSDKNK